MSALRARLLGVSLLVALGVAGCGGDPAPVSRAPAIQESQGRQVGGDAAPSGSAGSGPGQAGGAVAGLAPSAGAGAPGATKHAFPVPNNQGSYSHDHHDYPASDIMAACGLTAVSPVNGTVLEVTRVDTWTAKVNAGASRGGLSVSILGDDGARYYLSHFSAIDQDRKSVV